MTVAEDMRTEAAGVKAVSATTAGTMAVGTAAQELRLKRGEFAIAVHLGLIRLIVRQDGGRPRVGHDELDRLRAQEGFPEALRARVRTVGTAKGRSSSGSALTDSPGSPVRDASRRSRSTSTGTARSSGSISPTSSRGSPPGSPGSSWAGARPGCSVGWKEAPIAVRVTGARGGSNGCWR